MVAPKGYFQSVDKDGYVQAQLAVSRRAGVLRFTVVALLLSAIFIVSGVQVMFTSVRTVIALVTGLALLCVAVMIAIAFFMLIPEAVKATAERQFSSYNKLSNHVDVTFTSETVELKNEYVTRRAEFAKTRLCIELPERFVLITDDDTVIILEKSRFSEPSATDAFLRDVCARWYVKKGGGAI